MASTDISGVWVYLSASPLFGLTITLVIYGIAYRLYRWSNSAPLLNPVGTSVITLIGVLLLTNTSYETYFAGAQFIHFLLGPATVALAIPLHKQWPKLVKLWLPIVISITVGITASTLSTVLIAKSLGATLQTQLSLAPKSVTAPVAMGISEQIGGIPSLTAALVVITGIIGASFSSALFKIFRIQGYLVQGTAMGVTAHGIGTARAFQVSSEMGAFSGLAMALSALASSLLVPWLLGLIGIVFS